MAIHRAHLAMLAGTGIVATGRRAPAAGRAGRDRSRLGARRTPFDGACEDLFFYVDGLLAAACGRDVAGRLHTARSRNDIDMTMYRMQLRELLLALMDATLELRDSLVDLARTHTMTVFPAHTHTQPAQPTTVAHYLLAVIEQLERDSLRLPRRTARRTGVRWARAPSPAPDFRSTGPENERAARLRWADRQYVWKHRGR